MLKSLFEKQDVTFVGVNGIQVLFIFVLAYTGLVTIGYFAGDWIGTKLADWIVDGILGKDETLVDEEEAK